MNYHWSLCRAAVSLRQAVVDVVSMDMIGGTVELQFGFACDVAIFKVRVVPALVDKLDGQA